MATVRTLAIYDDVIDHLSHEMPGQSRLLAAKLFAGPGKMQHHAAVDLRTVAMRVWRDSLGSPARAGHSRSKETEETGDKAISAHVSDSVLLPPGSFSRKST